MHVPSLSPDDSSAATRCCSSSSSAVMAAFKLRCTSAASSLSCTKHTLEHKQLILCVTRPSADLMYKLSYSVCRESRSARLAFADLCLAMPLVQHCAPCAGPDRLEDCQYLCAVAEAGGQFSGAGSWRVLKLSLNKTALNCVRSKGNDEVLSEPAELGHRRKQTGHNYA